MWEEHAVQSQKLQDRLLNQLVCVCVPLNKKDIITRALSIAQLERAMVLGKLGEQIVLMSEKAFDSITFEGSIAAPKELYLPKKLARDTTAREEFQKEKGKGSLLTEKYVLDIMREGWKDDDERLQRVILG